MAKYFSCRHIRKGFNFYRSGKLTSCCFSLDPCLVIGTIDDQSIPQRILLSQRKLIKLHKSGNAPAPCLSCHNFRYQEWSDHLDEKFFEITLNHYKACNLRCTHCGYRKDDFNECDTDHDKVLDAIKKCIDEGICAEKLYLGVGGGEPSLSKGIHTILNYALENDWQADINSNAASFSPLFALGVNRGNFNLWLTPDAGSPETYLKIKGVDNFKNAWRYIKTYMHKTNGKAFVKFIIEAGNKDDIVNMILTSNKNDVRTLVLSFDMNINKDNFEDYRLPILQFIHLAHMNGIDVMKGPFLPKELFTEQV